MRPSHHPPKYHDDTILLRYVEWFERDDFLINPDYRRLYRENRVILYDDELWGYVWDSEAWRLFRAWYL